MKVKEMIALLEKYNPNADVMIKIETKKVEKPIRLKAVMYNDITEKDLSDKNADIVCFGVNEEDYYCLENLE